MLHNKMILALLCLVALGGAGFASEDGQSPGTPGLAAWRAELASRYESEAWPGKDGPVMAGIRATDVGVGTLTPVLDHVSWVAVEDESVVWREFAIPRQGVTARVAVARSCAAAHRVFFDHLARPRSMMPLEAPALPYGSVRTEGIGDVGFAMPSRGEGGARDGHHAIEFVRNNVVVLLRADAKAARRLENLARTIDAAITRKPAFDTADEARAWPVIQRFAATAQTVRAGTSIPLLMDVRDPRGEGISRSFEIEAGGIVTRPDGTWLHVEGTGRQTVTLRVTNESGLATTAQVVLEVVK